jgi:hypothetical protein
MQRLVSINKGKTEFENGTKNKLRSLIIHIKTMKSLIKGGLVYFWTMDYVHPLPISFPDFLTRFSLSSQVFSLYTSSALRSTLHFFNIIDLLLIKN